MVRVATVRAESRGCCAMMADCHVCPEPACPEFIELVEWVIEFLAMTAKLTNSSHAA
ncbi:MAG: hypothetical protein J4O01_01910 [Chloroflexi bacterium]|nr:hypothetical protein [Chloroflexota bacterium]MCI0850793.1 hypothetical protein [Chloroflexota bacterium]MCI0870682.1 hypothetical protein [Chloroflexota bacterium]MCI0872688.1 hypothetical protein [Chloroflexota bacterium]